MDQIRSLSQLLEYAKKIGAEKGPKTEAGVREVELSDAALGALSEQRAAVPEGEHVKNPEPFQVELFG